jgi:hypothetical protein
MKFYVIKGQFLLKFPKKNVKHVGSANSIFVFQYDGGKQYTTRVRNVKFCMKIEHKCL